MEVKDIKKADIFSEVSHYVATEDYDGMGGPVKLIHMESRQPVNLSPSYVENVLQAGDQFDTVIEVGKEDKLWTAKQLEEAEINKTFKTGEFPKVGDVRIKGIRTIWKELVSSHVFTVCFLKADKSKTKKALKEELEAQQAFAVGLIEKAKKDKKSMAEAYKIALEYVQNNPIKDYIEGEERILRGYKLQFTSRDGRYDCIDVDIAPSSSESTIRPVNINTIQYLVFNGVKYIVK